MPHLTLQYTHNVEGIRFSELFSDLHQGLARVGEIDVNNCKSRAIRLDDYYVADGNGQEGFAHLQILLLEGRSVALSRDIGEHCLEVLRRHVESAVPGVAVQLSLEVRDMRRETYLKGMASA